MENPNTFNNPDTMEIFLSDLTPECQQRLIEFLGGDNGNYDVFPIVTINN